MQGPITSPGGMHASRPANHLALFALSVLLAACQAPRADSADAAQRHAANAITATSPALEQTATAPDHTDATQHADGSPYRPDDSYNRANLRPQYRQCVAASGAHASAIHACMDEEFHWQDERLRLAWGAIANGPDSSFKDRLADEQHIYMSDTYQKCHYDPSTKDQNQLIAAQPCLANRYANRADALEALIHNAPM